MNDLILITVSAIGGGIVGALGMSWLTVAKVADDRNVRCRNCRDVEWVCENHPDTPWAGLYDVPECCGGAGAPCPCCQRELSVAGIADEAERAHSRCADALQTVRGKLEAIEQLANSPDTIRKRDIRAVLGGDA